MSIIFIISYGMVSMFWFLSQASVRYKDALQDLTNLLKLDSNNVAAKKELEEIKSLWRQVSFKLIDNYFNTSSVSSRDSRVVVLEWTLYFSIF